MTIAYLTDVEGQWTKVASFCAENPHLRLDADRIELSEGTTFVFGGDAIDRGPSSRRIVACLTDAKLRYGDRVVLLGGNRDLNKLRLRRELTGHPHPRAPEEVRSDRAALLKWTLARTMGAPDAFEHRRTELGGASDEEVVDSYLADLEPDGALTRYLRLCTLAYRSGRTLFVHGGIGEDSLGYVPDRPGLYDADAWIEGLGAWYTSQLDAYVTGGVDDGWRAIIEYQQPAPGKRGNPRSVVYSCLSDEHNDPYLAPPICIERLRRSGVDRLIVGHTPSGDTPSVLRDPVRGFTQIMADNNYSRVSTAPRVTIDEEAISIEGHTILDDGRALDVSFTVNDEPTPVGLRIGDGPLVKAPLGSGEHLTLRYLPKYELEQRAARISERDPLAPPYPRA